MTFLANPPAIDASAIVWDSIGETDSLTRLLAHVRIAGLDMHLEARQVEYDEEGNQSTVDYSDDYDRLSGIADTAFETVEINGREYMLFALPYGR